MINIIRDRYVQIIRKELIKKGLIEDLKLDQGNNTVIVKTHLDDGRASLVATRAIMSLGTNKYGNLKVEVIKSELP